MNPVIFDTSEHDPGLVALSRHLSEFDCHDKVVGITDEGFLYAKDKVARLGHYEFFPDLLPWNGVEHVAISRCLGVKGLLCAIVLGGMGILAACAVWSDWRNEGPKRIKLALAGCGGSIVLLLGARRNRIRVRAGGRTLTWTSPPLGY